MSWTILFHPLSHSHPMPERKSGLYALAQRPSLYDAFQNVLVRRDGRRQLVTDYIKPQAGDRLLDIGCGPGSMRPYLGDVSYVGFDPEPAYIARARALYPGRGNFICSSVHTIAEQVAGSFDIAIALGVLHHLDDAGAVLMFSLARRLLKPGGRLITCDPVYRKPQRLLARVVIGLDRGRSVRFPEAYLALARSSFPAARLALRADFMRIPYDHCVLVCE